MKNFLILNIVIILICIPISDFAAFPVVDLGALTQRISQLQALAKQYQLLQQSLINARQRLEQAKQLVHDNSGHYGFGDLLNNEGDLLQQEWSPAQWDQALHGLAGGNPSRYQQLLSVYQKEHPVLPIRKYLQITDSDKARVYQQQLNTNRAATVNASYAFNDINSHLKKLYKLSRKIESAANVKAAMDLNSRLLTELGYIEVQQLKMSALFNQQLAQQGATTVAVESQAARFNQL